MLHAFEDLPWNIGVFVMVSTFIFLACCGVLLVRLFISPKQLKGHHDVAAVVFANLGVLYSVLLGFTVVNVQQRFDKIKENTLVEASYLSELYKDAEAFSTKDRQLIQKGIVDYAKSVINVEWPLMAESESHIGISQPLTQLWNAYFHADTENKKQEQWYDVSINKLNQLMNARLARLAGSQESLGDEMWTMLIGGAIVITAFMCFFGLESLVSHLLMVSFIAGTIAFLLFLIYSLDTAFFGSVSIDPDAFIDALKTFNYPVAEESTATAAR